MLNDVDVTVINDVDVIMKLRNEIVSRCYMMLRVDVNN